MKLSLKITTRIKVLLWHINGKVSLWTHPKMSSTKCFFFFFHVFVSVVFRRSSSDKVHGEFSGLMQKLSRKRRRSRTRTSGAPSTPPNEQSVVKNLKIVKNRARLCTKLQNKKFYKIYKCSKFYRFFGLFFF